jgi:hypothetical protein
MSARRCITCAQPLPACTCPPPPPPDTLTRATQLQADRARVWGWLGRSPGQEHPLVRAWVDAALQHARDADEPTIQALLGAYGPIPRRRRGTGRYQIPAQFAEIVGPLIQRLRDAAEYPSADKVAAALPTTLSERHLRRLVHQWFHLTWENFLQLHFSPRPPEMS